jgi:hypothetical protein
MNELEQDRMRDLLKQSLPPVEADAEPGRDLWPAVLKRMDEQASTPWFDWVLAGGLVVMGAFFPAAIPVLLYYL